MAVILPPQQRGTFEAMVLARHDQPRCAVCARLLYVRRPDGPADTAWELRCLEDLAHVGVLEAIPPIAETAPRTPLPLGPALHALIPAGNGEQMPLLP